MKSFDSEQVQREMPWLAALPKARWLQEDAVASFNSYREAVVWCWEHRPERGKNEPDDQAMFARNSGVHAPHMSRYVSRHSKAPMDLKPDLIPEFEAYTGWRGVTQYLSRISGVLLFEEVKARRIA